MSNISQIIEERAANIGNFLVGRLLPFRQKRSVGPFVFIDHMGPTKLKEDENFDIAPHPHIGLSTLTYLFDGEIHHRDSIGSSLTIKPGAVNWMTAGRGVVHSERTPGHLRGKEKLMHGFQIWVALPKELENTDPSFYHTEAKDIPAWENDKLIFKLIAGKAFGKESPVPVHSELYFIEIKSSEEAVVDIGGNLYGEVGIYTLNGSIEIEGETHGEKQLLVCQNSKLCSFKMAANSTIYIFGGVPFPEERFIDWNFVSSDKSKLKEARENWQNQNYSAFPKVPGDEKEYVKLPG